jgi:hypothetical protein
MTLEEFKVSFVCLVNSNNRNFLLGKHSIYMRYDVHINLTHVTSPIGLLLGQLQILQGPITTS